MLLDKKLSRFVPSDSVYSYVREYRRLMEESLNQNHNQEALLQNTRYNYNLHDRERQKAEDNQKKLEHIIVLIVVVSLILLIIIFYLKNRSQYHLLQLREALDNLNELRQSLLSQDQNKQTPNNNISEEQIPPLPKKNEIKQEEQVQEYDDLRGRLKRELLELQRLGTAESCISPVILNSDAYTMVQDYIIKEKVIPESNALWIQLEKTIIDSSKDFKYRLQLLTGGKLKIQDYHLALLIKCGISPTHMAILVGRTKGTISYRREALCEKIFGEKLGVRVIDDIIRIL